MSLFELVERLCAIAHLQADIIKEQALALEQALQQHIYYEIPCTTTSTKYGQLKRNTSQS